MKSSLSLISNLSRAALRRAQFMVVSLILLISSALSAHEQVWRNVFGAGSHKCIAALNNGDFIVGGDFENTSDRDIVIRRLREDGTQVWQKTFNSLNDDVLTDLIADPVTGDTYVCGNGDANKDWFVMKFNGSDGSNGWMNAHSYSYSGGTLFDSANALSFVQDGSEVNIVVVGTVESFGGRVVLLNAASGATKWEHVAYLPPTNPNFSTNTGFLKVATDVDGNIYVTGQFGPSTATDQTNALLKFNVSSNSQIWKQSYKPNTGGSNNMSNIVIDPATKDIVVAGMLMSSAGNPDIGIARYNPAGTRLWATQVDGGAIDRANAVRLDGTNVYVGGLYRPDANSGNPQWFVGSFSFATGTENWRYIDGGNVGTGDSLGNIYVDGSKVYAAGTFNDSTTGINLALLELNKATGAVLDRTVFSNQVGSLLAMGNESMFVRADGDFIVATTAGSNIEVGRYTADGGGEPVATAPTITTPTSASVAMNSATLGGDVTADGGASITERGVVYALTSANSNPEIGGAGVTKVAAATPHGTGVFTVSVSSLVAKSGYTYKAYAQNSAGTVYTTAASFTTTGPTISVTGNEAAITNGATSATLSNHTVFLAASVDGATPSTTRTFTVRNTGNANLTLATGAVTITGTDFTVTTPPAATVSAGTETTFTVTFDPSTTGLKTATVSIASNDPAAANYTFAIQATATAKPQISNLNVTAVKGYSATLNADVTANGLGTTYSFEYSTESTIPAGSPSTSSTSLGVQTFTPAAASANIAELLPETTYYYRVVAENLAGTTTSSISSFTTSFPLSSNEPLTAANGMPNGGQIYRPIPGVINNAGNILFSATALAGSGSPAITGSNDELLMNDVTGIPRVVLREGVQIGSDSGHTAYALFNHLLLGASGQSFTYERIAGATTDKDYVYLAVSGEDSSVSIVSREGDTAPDGGVFINSVGKPALDSQENLYFQGSLSGVATTVATGVWYDNGEGIATLVQAGRDISTATGDPAWLGKISNILAAGGNGASFIATLQHNPEDVKQKTDALRNQAIVSANVEDEGTVITIIARKGDAVIDGTSINSINGLSRGATEGHAFTAMMKTGSGVTTANDEILATVVDGETVIIAREATTLLDGLTPKSFGDFYVTASGDVIFQAVLNGAPATSDGILCHWSADTGEVTKLAREGDAAPGTSLTYGTIHTVGVSDNGNIAMQTILSDGKHGLHRNTGSGFEFVAKAGDTIQVNSAARTILSIGLYSKTTGTGGGGGGMGSVINDSGDIFAVLSIGSGDYVARIFRSQPLPEPN